MSGEVEEKPRDFIRQIIDGDLASGKTKSVVTRFPPHPNGFLHIGHCFAAWTNYAIARDFGGRFHLRFDDTNPAAEDPAYVEAIQRDLAWLGCEWGDNLFFASDYFEELYGCALELIRRGRAFVCDLSSEEIEARRGTLTEPGIESPYRNRSVEENLDWFQRMRAGEFEPGARVLRAKFDMASSVLPNRDPVLYRIVQASHHRTGDAWPIYPLYDFSHCLEDSFEGITHSLCSLEFVDHRPLYDWVLDSLERECHPQQIEFARINVTHTVLSKRTLSRLVSEGHVSGWDDPRMPTLAALRRRGVPPQALRTFAEDVGITRVGDKRVQMAKLDACIRDELNRSAQRRMGVLRPLRVVIENYPEGQVEQMECVNNPEDPGAGKRQVPFSRELWIERDDFREEAPRKFFRMVPGREVRLRYAYLVTCTEVVKNAAGEVVEVRCTYDPETRGGDAPDGRKVKGTLHWVSASHALAGEARLYGPLFLDEVPDTDDLAAAVDPDSVERLPEVWLEPSIAQLEPGVGFQLERLGYFALDPDGSGERPVLNRTVGLRDTWAKLEKKGR